MGRPPLLQRRNRAVREGRTGEERVARAPVFDGKRPVDRPAGVASIVYYAGLIRE
jgi:hypothetical protein